MEEIVKLDADGKGKLKEKYEAKVKEIAEAKELDNEMQAVQQMLGPFMQNNEADKALAELDKLIAAPKNKMQHQVALTFKADITMSTTQDAAAALKMFEAAKDLLPNSVLAKNIDQFLPKLRELAEQAKKKDGKKEEGK